MSFRFTVELATTGIFVAKNNWDENFEGHCQKSHKVNEELSKIRGRIINIKNQLEYEERPISAKILKKTYIGEDQLKVFLLSTLKV